ncbi:MAG TPA: asparaginase [bacterium]|jgi:L-asparaginase
MIATGGTIAGKLGPSGEVTPSLTARELLSRVPAIDNYALLSSEDFLQVSSRNIGFREMMALARRVEQVLSDRDVGGVVITHGTATLEHTAYFLDIVLGHDRPVVLTGAMRNPTLPSDDGPLNLLDAIQVAACDRSRGLGVLVVMHGFVYSARDVTKCHSTNIGAFQSPEFGPLGAVDGDHVFYARRPFLRYPAVTPKEITARVERIPNVLAAADLPTALEKGIDGVVVEGVALVQRHPELFTGAVAQGVVIVVANPFLMGRLPRRMTSRGQGGESNLIDGGIVWAETSAVRAWIKLSIAMSAGLSKTQIRELFHSERQ